LFSDVLLLIRPNFFFAWNAYRVLCHYNAHRGALYALDNFYTKNDLTMPVTASSTPPSRLTPISWNINANKRVACTTPSNYDYTQNVLLWQTLGDDLHIHDLPHYVSRWKHGSAAANNSNSN
jgi:hypothetical protein